MAISAATPMNTPSMVSAERSLLRPIAWIAAETIIDAKASVETRAAPAAALSRG